MMSDGRKGARRDPRAGQLNTMEPIVIIIVLAVLAGLGLLFYARINDTQQTTAASAMHAQQDVALLATLSRLPEVACSRAETADTKCVDLGRAKAFADMLSEDRRSKNDYYPLFGDSRVSVRYVDEFVMGAPMDALVIYDNLEDADRVRATRTYFVLYDPEEERMMFAVLLVERGVS